MPHTLPSQFSTEMNKQGYKPRVSISITSLNQYISGTETFQTNSQTYTGSVQGSPSIRIATNPLGGMTKITNFQVTVLNQELFSNIFNTYPTPENAEVIVKLYFDDGTQVQENEGLQLFKGKIKDFPAITYDSVQFNVETNNLLVDRMLGDLIEDGDSDLIPTVGEASVGKVKPIAYGDHTAMKDYGYPNINEIHFSQSHSIWPCLWFNEDGDGSNHWIVANHTINEPDLPTTVGNKNFWAIDSDTDRFVRVQDSDVTALSAVSGKDHVHVKLAKDVYYYDWTIPTSVSDISSQCGTGSSSVTGDDNAIDKDLTTKAVHSVTSDDGDAGTCDNDAELSFAFPQSYPVADDDIEEVKVYAVAATTAEDTGTSFEINGTSVYRPQDLNSPTLFECGTDAATAAGVVSPVVSRLRIVRDQAGAQNLVAGSETYFVWKQIKYKKTHVIGKDDNDDPIIVPKKLPLYCAGKGMEYGSWVNSGRTNGAENAVIETGAGVIESIMRDHLGLVDADIREADFDVSHSALSTTKISLHINKQIKARELIDKIAKTVKSAVFFDYDNKVAMKTFPVDGASFSVSGTNTAGTTDIFTFSPSVSSGSFTNHPIIRNSFSLMKIQNNLANTVTINYAKFHTGDYAKTSSSTDTTFISDDYKDTKPHDFTSDTTTAELYRDFLLTRKKRKYWGCKFRTFLNGAQLEINDVINVRHPVLDGIFGTSEMNAKKWVVYSITMALGAYEIEVMVVELTTSYPS